MIEKVKEEFRQPAAEFSPVPFWFWNDEPDEAAILAQIRDFHEKGVDGFVIHPRTGLPKSVPYLSDRYMEFVRLALREAKRLGMRVILYDECMYPSGSAHGMVAAENPEYASKCLKTEDILCTGDMEIACAPDLVAVVAMVEYGTEKAERVEQDVLNTLDTDVRGSSGCRMDLVSAAALMEDGGRYRFHVPDDRVWHLFLFRQGFSGGTIRGPYEGEDDFEPDAPKSADLLNPDAVHTFIRLTYDRYYEAAGEFFGDPVIAMFTDEPNILGRCHEKKILPWTDGFLEYYLAQGGRTEDLAIVWLAEFGGKDKESRKEKEMAAVRPENFGGKDEERGKEAGVARPSDFSRKDEKCMEEAAAARRRFRGIVNRRMTEVYYGSLSKWCADHGIALTGHPETSQDIGLLEAFQIPGQDLCLRMVDVGHGVAGFDSVLGKCSSDAARHRGRRRNGNECLGCCGPAEHLWAMTADDMKWYLDWLFVRGVNLPVLHAFYYSLEGEERYGERPPDIGPGNIWWSEFKTISSYIRRMCWLMTDSFNVTPVAVLCEADRMPWKIARPLYENQIEFNYLEEALILDGRCRIDHGSLVIERQRYRYLLVEDGSLLTGELAEKLRGFADGGGQIVKVDQLDGFVAGWREKGGDARISPAAAGLRVSHVVKDGVPSDNIHEKPSAAGSLHFYLLVNEGEETIRGTFSVPFAPEEVEAEWWDAWSGEMIPASERRVRTQGQGKNDADAAQMLCDADAALTLGGCGIDADAALTLRGGCGIDADMAHTLRECRTNADADQTQEECRTNTDAAQMPGEYGTTFDAAHIPGDCRTNTDAAQSPEDSETNTDTPHMPKMCIAAASDRFSTELVLPRRESRILCIRFKCDTVENDLTESLYAADLNSYGEQKTDDAAGYMRTTDWVSEGLQETDDAAKYMRTADCVNEELQEIGEAAGLLQGSNPVKEADLQADDKEKSRRIANLEDEEQRESNGTVQNRPVPAPVNKAGQKPCGMARYLQLDDPEGQGERIALTGDWKVSLVSRVTVGRPAVGSAHPPAVLRADGLRSWTEWPGMEHFTGKIACETEFELTERQSDGTLILDLGEVHELAWVTVNGRACGVRMWAPYRFDITSFVRAGINTLRVETANTMANHLEHARIASGLLGPVGIWRI